MASIENDMEKGHMQNMQNESMMLRMHDGMITLLYCMILSNWNFIPEAF